MKVWIVKEDINAHKSGDIVMHGDTWTSWLKPFCDEVDVGDINIAHLSISKTSEGSYEFSENITSKLTEEVTRKITDLYQVMTDNILAEMKSVFDTNKSDSALANELTWKEMARAGTPFASLGLVSDTAFAEFEIGDKLDTATKIKSYANMKILGTRAYSVFRVKEIENFRVAKAALLAEYGL